MDLKNLRIDSIRDFFKRWPHFYHFYINVLGPFLWCGKGPKTIIEQAKKIGPILNLGSGPKKIDVDVINVDINKYHGVDVVADISNLPFEDSSVGGIILESVLEHLRNPTKVISEVKRVLKPNGMVYVNLPWLYPYHASPDDYSRWTISGLKQLFGDFEFVESGIRSGPFSSLVVNLSYVLALICSLGFSPLYFILIHIFMLVLMPIKLLDLVFVHFPHASDSAGALYFIVRKK